MTDVVRYTKAFAKALSEHLRGAVPRYTDTRYGGGGCDTCGFGASEYEVLDVEALDKVIAEFESEFAKEHEANP